MLTAGWCNNNISLIFTLFNNNNNGNGNRNGNGSGSDGLSQNIWLCGRNIECLLFKLTSLIEIVNENEINSSQSSSLSLLPSPSLSLSPSVSQSNSTNNSHISEEQTKKNWFGDVCDITILLLNNLNMREILLLHHPAVSIRLLELWIAVKRPEGKKMLN